jgi:hypothetical protein
MPRMSEPHALHRTSCAPSKCGCPSRASTAVTGSTGPSRRIRWPKPAHDKQFSMCFGAAQCAWLQARNGSPSARVPRFTADHHHPPGTYENLWFNPLQFRHTTTPEKGARSRPYGYSRRPSGRNHVPSLRSVRHCGPSIATAGPRRQVPICWSKLMAAPRACPLERPGPYRDRVRLVTRRVRARSRRSPRTPIHVRRRSATEVRRRLRMIDVMTGRRPWACLFRDHHDTVAARGARDRWSFNCSKGEGSSDPPPIAGSSTTRRLS